MIPASSKIGMNKIKGTKKIEATNTNCEKWLEAFKQLRPSKLQRRKILKTSKYYISAKIDNCVLYYNLVNDTLLSLPAALEEGCIKCLENPNDKDTIYWQKLYNDHFILDDNHDEMKEIQHRHWRSANAVSEYSLTVLCTLKCNSECTYCYQRNLEFEYEEMTESDFDGLYQYLCQVPQRNIHINWFGGEPMLLKNQILSFCRKADRDRKHLYSHSLSTNGSIYDERFFREMEQYGLTNVNASMVGLGDIHNKLRPSQDYDAETVVKNLLKMTRHTTVVININLCKSNIDQAKEILERFVSYQYLPIRFNFSRIASYDHIPCKEEELDIDTYMKQVIELSNWALDQGFVICDMSCFQNFGVYCGAYSKHNEVVGPGLYVYQCDRTYNPADAKGQIVEGRFVWKDNCADCENAGACLDPFAVEECKDCKILPYCNGGCDYLRKIGKSACPVENDYLEEYLKLYYRIFYQG